MRYASPCIVGALLSPWVYLTGPSRSASLRARPSGQPTMLCRQINPEI